GLAALVALGHLVETYLRALRRYAVAAALVNVVPRLVVVLGLLALWLRGTATAAWATLAALSLVAQIVTRTIGAVALRATSGDGWPPSPAAIVPPPLFALGEMTATLGVRGIVALFLYSADLWVLSSVRPHADVAVYGLMARLIQAVAAAPALVALLVPQEL